jgi:hypothetical protein
MMVGDECLETPFHRNKSSDWLLSLSKGGQAQLIAAVQGNPQTRPRTDILRVHDIILLYGTIMLCVGVSYRAKDALNLTKDKFLPT